MSTIGKPLESFRDIDKYNDAVPLRKDRPASLNDFFTYVRLCLIDYQQLLGVDHEDFVRFNHSDPPLALEKLDKLEEEYGSKTQIAGLEYPTNVSTLDLRDSSVIAPSGRYGDFTVVEVFGPTGEKRATGPIGCVVLRNNSMYTFEVTAIIPDPSGGSPRVETTEDVEPETNYALAMPSGVEFDRKVSVIYSGRLLNSNLYEDRAIDSVIEAKFKPTITYSLKLKEPGTVEGKPFGSKREWKPRLRTPNESYIDPERPDYSISEYGQRFDCLIQFDVWTETHIEAEELADWFEDFMYKYTGVYQKNGVHQVLFWKRMKDETVTAWRNDVVHRSLVYYVQIESMYYVDIKNVEDINFTIRLIRAVPSGFQL